jgi:hypothetical protein
MASGSMTSSDGPDRPGADWYYADHIGAVGPVTFQDLKNRLAAIPNPDRVLVRREGMTEWQRAGDVRELFPSQSARPASSPDAGTSAPRARMKPTTIAIWLIAGLLVALAVWAALR